MGAVCFGDFVHRLPEIRYKDVLPHLVMLHFPNGGI